MQYMTIADIGEFNDRCDRDFPQLRPGTMHWNDPRQAWHRDVWSGEPLSEVRRSLVLDAAEMGRIGGYPRHCTICAQCVRDALRQYVPAQHIIALTTDEVAAWLDIRR